MKCPVCEVCVESVKPVSGAWMTVRFGHDGLEHWSKRGEISAAVDVEPHYLTICGLSLGEMVLTK